MKRIFLLLTIVTGLAVATPPVRTNLKELCSDEEAELEFERDRFTELTQCLALVLNATEFRSEIMLAGDTSKVDAIVSKVCRNLPQIVQCTSEYVSSIGPCLDDEEKREKELWRNLRQMNMEFACGPGKHHLIKFIDEGGFQCIATHRTGITNCVNDKFPTLLNQQSDTQIVKTLALITRQSGKCNSLKEVEGCVNSELIKCMEQESFNIIRQYFSSLDVLFSCDNSTTEEPHDTQVNSTGLHTTELDKEILQTLVRIQDNVERLAATIDQKATIQQSADKRMMDVLEQQTAALSKLSNIVETISISKFRKVEPRLLSRLSGGHK